MLQIGSVVDRKYKILSEVGHGGMSVVYLAINERANKTWAVKEVRKDGVVDFEAVKQGLVVETDMLKRLNHPHLPSIIDVIDTEDSFLIVMDYIEGTSLEKYLRKNGAIPQEKVLKWGKQLCDVLGYLHNQNPPIIYRDMKPANVMLKPDGDIALIDFGTAREFKDRAMVEDTTCLGTRGYAAPEQFGGRGQTDARTDIYCLGATLYHLLTGHSPAEPPYEIKPLRYWLPQYAGTGIEKVILKCCQQDPSARYQGCAELMYALQHVDDEDDAARKSRKRRWAAFVASLVIGIVGVIGTVGFGIARGGAEKESYQYQITQAESCSTLKEAEIYYRTAMNADPGEAQAYNSLLGMILRDYNENGNFTVEAQTVLKECLMDTSGGSEIHKDSLKASDRENYDKLMYQIGLLYFFMAGDNNKTRETAANSYFSEVVESEYLTQAELELANRLNTIGGYISSLSSKANQFGLSDANSYKDLWTDMNSMISGDLRDKVGRDIYAIKIYELAANWIYESGQNFKNEAITEEDMQNTVQVIENGLNSLNVAQSDQEALENARGTLDQARSMIARVYQKAAE